jgi:hypothetical protein
MSLMHLKTMTIAAPDGAPPRRFGLNCQFDITKIVIIYYKNKYFLAQRGVGSI